MKLYPAAFFIAGVLALAGLYLIYPVQAVSGQFTATLPAGNHYDPVPFNINQAGRITGTFSETSGNHIDLYIFDSSQFQSFRSTGATGAMYSDSASSGTFSAAITTSGTYYIVFQHASNTVGDAQTVQVIYVIDGKNLLMIGAGASLIATGILLSIFGASSRRRLAAPRMHADIVMFAAPCKREELRH